MGRPKKVLATKANTNAAMHNEGDSPTSSSGLMVQSRSRRMIKPNPKYNSKEIIPLKRLELDDDDMEGEDGEADDGDQDNTEDDEDFHDDGARDSDPDETPGTRRRGRPRLMDAARSEPAPMRKIQQIRAGYKESVAMSASKLQQQSGASLDKKRKIDFDGDDDFEDQPAGKRRAAGAAVAGGRPTTTAAGEKENAAVLKKNSNNSFTIVNIDKLIGSKAATNKTAAAVEAKTPVTGGVTTRRTLNRDSGGGGATPAAAGTKTATPSPVALALRTASNAAKETPPTSKSMIQVRRATPMNQPAATTPNKVTVATNRVVQQTKPANAASPALVRNTNRTGIALTPRPLRAMPAAASPAVTVMRTPAAGPVTAAKANITMATIKTPGGTTIPPGAEVERLPDGKTTRITTYEKRFVVRMAPEAVAPQSPLAAAPKEPFICLAQLRTDIKQLKLPARWAYQVKLMRVKNKSKGQATVTVQRATEEGEFEVFAIEMNRLASPQLVNGAAGDKKALKYDRTVVLQQKQFHITVDGQAVRLVGAPDQLATMADVETLVQIVDSVALTSEGVVERLDEGGAVVVVQ